MYTAELNTILTRFARKLSQRHDVGDLVQQTFLKMYTNSEKFDGKSLKSWGCTILKNEFINECRFNSKREFTSIGTASNQISNFKTDEPINLYYLTKQIESLPNKLKNDFVDYLNGYKYEEIAERNDQALGAVKSNIHRARKILSKVA
jgi:RNA polymerase sigma factor (sigma-70 family)